MRSHTTDGIFQLFTLALVTLLAATTILAAIQLV